MVLFVKQNVGLSSAKHRFQSSTKEKREEMKLSLQQRCQPQAWSDSSDGSSLSPICTLGSNRPRHTTGVQARGESGTCGVEKVHAATPGQPTMHEPAPTAAPWMHHYANDDYLSLLGSSCMHMSRCIRGCSRAVFSAKGLCHATWKCNIAVGFSDSCTRRQVACVGQSYLREVNGVARSNHTCSQTLSWSR